MGTGFEDGKHDYQVGEQWKGRHSRKPLPKSTPPAEPKSTRVYSPDEVIEQFKFRLGGLDPLGFSSFRGKRRMIARLGRHKVSHIFTIRDYESKEIAEACALIFDGLRNSMRGEPAVA